MVGIIRIDEQWRNVIASVAINDSGFPIRWITTRLTPLAMTMAQFPIVQYKSKDIPRLQLQEG